MSKLVIFEAHTLEAVQGGYMHECHAKDCKDAVKKNSQFFDGYFADSIEDAILTYEANNEDFIAEGGAGYDWNEMVKVFPCIAKAGA